MCAISTEIVVTGSFHAEVFWQMAQLKLNLNFLPLLNQNIDVQIGGFEKDCCNSRAFVMAFVMEVLRSLTQPQLWNDIWSSVILYLQKINTHDVDFIYVCFIFAIIPISVDGKFDITQTYIYIHKKLSNIFDICWCITYTCIYIHNNADR